MKATPTKAPTKAAPSKVAPTQEQLIHDLIETHGRPLVNALTERGLLDWLENHQRRVTAAQITARLRLLPPAVIHRSHAHMHRRQREGPTHRCADCAFR